MENIDITEKAKIFIRFGLITLLILSSVIGYAVFNYYHAAKNFQIDNAKVTSQMLAVRALAAGKIKEMPFNDGDTVQAGDVIAKVEVSVTPEQIQELENALASAKQNYENLKLGQTVKVAVKKQKVVEPSPAPAPASPDGQKNQPPATLESLAERARRMDELFDMGAVSSAQRDAAKKKYEDALANGLPSTPSENGSSSSNVVEEIEYVDQWQPTPPVVLAAAESTVKQAELALNVAKQESQQTEITAPFSGVIYYFAALEGDLTAGDVVAKIGGNHELWLEAEVEEDIFDKIPLGKMVSYELAGKKFSGTLIEKISPTKTEDENTEENKNNSTESEEPKFEKYTLRFSIPAEKDVEIKPNTTTSVHFTLKNIF